MENGTPTSATHSLPVAPTTKSTPHLAYLDGLRGLAALYVVLYHAQGMVSGVPKTVDLALSPISLGRFAVTVFIALSGYCLMLPVARSRDTALSGGFWGYLKRRAWRILPPYYVALAASLLLLAIVPGIHPDESGVSNFSAASLLSHLFLVHNFHPQWAHAINPPMWSVATEWQIYFFFPLLLLPIWKRWGISATVLVAYLVGLIPFYFMGASDLASPWFLGVFACGMCGAVVSFSAQERLIRLRQTIAWNKTALLILGVFLVAILTIKVGGWENVMREHFRWVLDAVLGFAVTFLLIGYTKYLTDGVGGKPRGAAPGFLRLLESRPAVVAGGFSYSLYLIHNPLLELGHLLLERAHARPLLQIVFMLGIVVPVTVAVSYLFSYIVERPLLARKQAIKNQRPPSSVVEAPAS